MSFVTLTVVPDEEKPKCSGLLRVNGVECFHRKKDVAAGSWTLGFSTGGPIEVLVAEDDLDDAKQLLSTVE